MATRPQSRAAAPEVAPTNSSPGIELVEPLNDWLERHLFGLGSGGPVLDLGCGRGDWLRRMTAGGLVPVGIEHDPVRARVARSFGPVAVADGAGLPMRAQAVSMVWCIHVLHHLPDPVATLAEARRVLRPGGHLLMAETVEDHPVIRLARRIHPEWDGVAIQSRFTAEALTDMVTDAGFDIVDSRHHSLISFAAWALPMRQEQAWRAATRFERLLPPALNRFGAHLECLARAT